MKGYITVSEAAERSRTSERDIEVLCENGRIEGAEKMDGIWHIPAIPGLDIRSMYGKDTKVYEETSDGRGEGCSIHQAALFPGIMLVFHDIHAEHLDFSGTQFSLPADVISIQHCMEGRFEGEYRNGECFYLGPGDLSVNLPVSQPDSNSFPLAHYHGLNLIINPAPASEYIAGIEGLVGPLGIDLGRISDRLSEGNHLVIYRENILDHILSEIYAMKSDDGSGLIRMKVLELLSSLSSLEDASPVRPLYFNRSQVRTVKDIHACLTSDPGTHYTLEDLSSMFDIPLTSMKTCFKGVYGSSIGAYMRDYRLQLAAELLRGDGCIIGDIAFQVGYESPSKFTEAFRRKFGCSPSSYRKDVMEPDD